MILVTGATGNLGGALLDSLQAKGVACRAAVTSLQKAEALFPEIPKARLDFFDPSTFAPALEGCKGLFLVRPPAIADIKATISPFLDVAAQKGIEHVIFVSVMGAEKNTLIPHYKIEQKIFQSQLPYTLLRPGFFCQNIGDAYRLDIVEDNRIILPSKNARVAFLDVRDIADVASRVFFQKEHKQKAYTLTGQETVSFAEVAAMLTEILERPIHYESVGALRYVMHLRRRHGLPWMQILIQTILHVRLGQGSAEGIDPILTHLLGGAARSMREYLWEAKALWKKE